MSPKCDWSACSKPIAHGENFDGRERFWCEEHTPWSGHYELCPERCAKVLTKHGLTQGAVPTRTWTAARVPAAVPYGQLETQDLINALEKFGDHRYGAVSVFADDLSPAAQQDVARGAVVELSKGYSYRVDRFRGSAHLERPTMGRAVVVTAGLMEWDLKLALKAAVIERGELVAVERGNGGAKTILGLLTGAVIRSFGGDIPGAPSGPYAPRYTCVVEFDTKTREWFTYTGGLVSWVKERLRWRDEVVLTGQDPEPLPNVVSPTTSAPCELHDWRSHTHLDGSHEFVCRRCSVTRSDDPSTTPDRPEPAFHPDSETRMLKRLAAYEVSKNQPPPQCWHPGPNGQDKCLNPVAHAERDGDKVVFTCVAHVDWTPHFLRLGYPGHIASHPLVCNSLLFERGIKPNEQCLDCAQGSSQYARTGQPYAGSFTRRDANGDVIEWCCQKMAMIDLTRAINRMGRR